MQDYETVSVCLVSIIKNPCIHGSEGYKLKRGGDDKKNVSGSFGQPSLFAGTVHVGLGKLYGF